MKRTKKVLAMLLSTLMVLSMMAIPAFAASATVTVPTDAVVAGQEFEIVYNLADNDVNVAVVTIGLDYDSDAFEFVSASSDFGTPVVGDSALSIAMASGTKATGKLARFVYKVKDGAQGGAYDFTIKADPALEVCDADANAIITSLDNVQVTISAPAPLDAPVVAVANKKATWNAVTNANEYEVVISKDGTAIYTTTTTATELDFAGKVTETATYGATVKALANGYLWTESAEGYAEEEYVIDATITPTEKAYVTGSNGFEVTMTLNGNTFTGITGLTDGTDYSVNGNVVTINDSALTADTTLEFTFDKGAAATVDVTVTAAADAVNFILAERAASPYDADDTVANDGTEDGVIVVASGSNDPLTNFTAVSFKVANDADTGYDKIDYEIVPAEGFALLYHEETGVYEINVKPVEGVEPAISETTAKEGIVIGYLKYEDGYGKGTISASDIRITTEKADNLYTEFAANEAWEFTYEVKEKTQKLTVVVDFNNPTVTDNAADYEQMEVNVYSARLGNITKELGDGATDVTVADNKYTVVFEELPAYDTYTVTISGEGYRKAKTTPINLNEDKTVLFWNNAKDSDAIYIKTDAGVTEKMISKNFLAGDIIMDGTIDLYDLSAVSSYFGKGTAGVLMSDDAEANADYIQYDLNRDGKVDILDITMVIDGWAE